MTRVTTFGTTVVALAVAAVLTSPKLGVDAASDGGQAPSGIAKPWVMPRTADGKPDLQGTWSNATLTPLERGPKESLHLSEEEAARIENRTREVAEFRDAPSDPNRPPPAKGGDERPLPPGDPTFIERISAAAGGAVGGYNNFWLDPGEGVLRIDGKPRAGMVIDPPDGRVPGLTPEARQRMGQQAAVRKKFGQFDHPELRGLAERCRRRSVQTSARRCCRITSTTTTTRSCRRRTT